MNFYKRHLGDYAKKAGHLSALEHGVFNLILDGYYDREHAPTLTEAVRWARARTEEEKGAVVAVLDEFFTEVDGRYVQSRVEEEIALYRQQAETNQKIAAERERRKRERRVDAAANDKSTNEHESCTDRTTTVAESSQDREPSHKPLAISHKPVSKTPHTPQGGIEPAPKPARASRGIALKTFLADCKAKEQRPIRDYEPLWNYTRSAGLPDDFVALAWVEFCRRFGAGGVKEAKVQKDWRQTFRNYVEGNFLKLWAIGPEGYFLTTQGKQAQTVAEAA